MNSATKTYILAAIVAVIVTVSMTLAIMYITRSMSAGQTIMVWLAVLGVVVLALFVTRRSVFRRQR